jgi:DNA polymerase I-like protein with 3'-5' exonuclease and polymerase domains
MELRILADLSREPKWLEIFEKGLDMHCEIGTMLFGVPIRLKGTNGPNDPGENTHLRKIVKSINFGVGG